jgi:hypothetical protein
VDPVDRAGQEISPQRGQHRQFVPGEYGGWVDIAEPKPIAAAPPPVAGQSAPKG